MIHAVLFQSVYIRQALLNVKRALLRLLSHQRGLVSHHPGFLNHKVRLISLPTMLEIKVTGQNVPLNGTDLHDPDSSELKASFTTHLQNRNFRGMLSFDQESDTLDNYSIPLVNCLFSSTLDYSIQNPIFPPSSRNRYTRASQRTSLCTEGHAEENSRLLFFT